MQLHDPQQGAHACSAVEEREHVGMPSMDAALITHGCTAVDTHAQANAREGQRCSTFHSTIAACWGDLSLDSGTNLFETVPEVLEELGLRGIGCVLHDCKHGCHFLLFWCQIHRLAIIQHLDSMRLHGKGELWG
eukprot:1158919-Pelagomonas_calceolata.AAC.6